MSLKVNPYQTLLDVNGKTLAFEIDTGAGVTIISSATYEMHFQEFRLLPTDIKIRTYSATCSRLTGGDS